MIRLLLLLSLATIPAFSQCTIQIISGTQAISTAPPKLNANFASLNTCKTNRYSGSTVPGVISSSRLGDLYTRTGTTEAYMCFSGTSCTAVASGNWVLLGTGSGGTGTVTVVGAGNLTSTACVTGGGSQAIQTPSSTCTIDSSGNISTPGTAAFGAGGSAVGVIAPTPGTVGTLPTCDSSIAGGRASVTDANATTFLSVVAAGGSNKVPVFCDGTNWKIG